MTKQEEIIIENMARVGYQAMHDLDWGEAILIERALWLVVASSMLNELRRLWQLEKR